MLYFDRIIQDLKLTNQKYVYIYVTRHVKRYLKGPSDKIEILTSFSRANLKL